VLEFLAKERKEREKEIKGEQIGKEAVKLSLYVDYVILYIKDPKNPNKKTLKSLKNTFVKVVKFKVNIQKSVTLLYTKNKQVEKEIRKVISLTISSKK
jgi:hypothetical protein